MMSSIIFCNRSLFLRSSKFQYVRLEQTPTGVWGNTLKETNFRIQLYCTLLFPREAYQKSILRMINYNRLLKAQIEHNQSFVITLLESNCSMCSLWPDMHLEDDLHLKSSSTQMQMVEF